MRVVLRADVGGLGRRGDIVEVSGGYARNHLLPNGQAMRSTEGITAQATAMRRSRDLREARDREAAEGKARVLAGATVTVPARASGAGRLFGSVTASDIAAAARQQLSVELDRHNLALEEPIKELGAHELQVSLHRDVVTVVTVEVVPA